MMKLICGETLIFIGQLRNPAEICNTFSQGPAAVIAPGKMSQQLLRYKQDTWNWITVQMTGHCNFKYQLAQMKNKDDGAYRLSLEEAEAVALIIYEFPAVSRTRLINMDRQILNTDVMRNLREFLAE